ncbi:MAG: methionine--tRNA ligase [Ignavibacteria bacterium]|nr:methionine--tRNA ligase [Ignavibacteria bacterium]
MDKKKYLITSALPYANGYIHLGHIAGAYLPADIFVKYKRLKKEDVIFICGSDEHGTAIEISALKEKVTPKEIIDRYHFANKRAFEELGIEFDIYSRTSNEIHHKTSQEFFLNLYNKNLLIKKSEKQLYSEKDKKFLADRFVEGTCPICGYEEARGDQCESCGSNLSPLELINPKSKISGDTPVIKESINFYFPLEKFQKKLEDWISQKTNWKYNVKNYCEGWFKTGLKDRAITRDLEWGVKVPLEGYEGKVIYVWFEAPIGYISATKELFIQRGNPEKWKEYWCDENTKLIHFIGKDNIVFHALVFPAMLMAHGEYILPDNVPANEFLNLEGGKLSKSKGHGILVKDVVKEYNPDLVRYVVASNLPENKDSDLSIDDFKIKNNNELAGILGNFINRTVVFAKNKFNNKIPARQNNESEILKTIKTQADIIEKCYESFRFRDALNETMNIARIANKFFNDMEPWNVIKTDVNKCGEIINDCLNICYSLAIAIYPILPFTSKKILKILNETDTELDWNKIGNINLKENRELGENEILFPQIENNNTTEDKEMEEEISITEFQKIKIKIAKVITCEKIPNSKKLLKLKIKIGDKEKQIVAGIAEHYLPDELIGKSIVVVSNMKKTKLMGIDSEGMLLAAKKDDKLVLLSTDKPIDDGADVN